MVHVEADTAKAAIVAAKKEWKPEPGYILTRVDHFEDNRIVIDC